MDRKSRPEPGNEFSGSSDLLASLLERVRTAARDGARDALSGERNADPNGPVALVDKKTLAHALGVSTASVDRLCREGLIPFVLVGDVRRFDLDAVRSALAERQRKTAGGEQ